MAIWTQSSDSHRIFMNTCTLTLLYYHFATLKCICTFSRSHKLAQKKNTSRILIWIFFFWEDSEENTEDILKRDFVSKNASNFNVPTQSMYCTQWEIPLSMFHCQKNPKWVCKYFFLVLLYSWYWLWKRFVGPLFKYSLTGLHKSILQYDTNRLLLCWGTYVAYICSVLYNGLGGLYMPF